MTSSGHQKEGETAMGNKSRKAPAAQATSMDAEQLALGFEEHIKSGLKAFVDGAGMLAVQMLLEQQREEVCGPRHQPSPERQAYRFGYTNGRLVLGGRRVSVKRPRVRSVDDHEVALPAWQVFRSRDPLDRRAYEQMVIGVSTRKYNRSLEPLAPGLKSIGTSRSAVSRRFVALTKAQLAKLADARIDEQFVAILIDGVHVCETVVLVALGITEQGEKRVLGIHEGATENATACRTLLAKLQERGLQFGRSMLFVIDGAKALRTAIAAVAGEHALVQRCQVHKRRNVLEHLPEKRRPMVEQALHEAHQDTDADRAERKLRALAARLREAHPSAAASIEEGLEETLTVARLGLKDALRRTLATTNPVENVVGRIRVVGRRVTRWRSGSMVLRWVGAAVVEASRGFRRIKGHGQLPFLIATLKERDRRLGLAAQKQAA
jgi:putative transposase